MFVALFVLGWIFFLGVMTGRGLVPDVIKVFIPSEGDKRQAVMSGEIPKSPVEPPLAFYNELAKTEESSGPEKPLQGQTASPQPPPPSPVAEAPTDDNLYCVQVASLESEAKAEQLAKRLRNRGHSAFISRLEHQGKVLFRVRCGLFATSGEAERLKVTISQKEKLNGFVVKADSGA